MGGTLANDPLTYDWEPVGIQPAPFSFSDNKSATATNMTATFQGSGIYHFQVTITDTLTSLSVITNVLDVQVVSKAASLSLTPAFQQTTADQKPQVTAVINDQFGKLMSNPGLPTITWASSAGSSFSAPGAIATISMDQTTRNITVTADITDTVDGKPRDATANIQVLFGSGGVGDVNQVTVGPVPFKSTSGLGGITFRKLNPGTKIRLFTTDGHLVQTFTIGSQTDQQPWDLTNSNGARVASGVYLYVIENNGQKKEGKLVLIL
jgi:hypothetical protein